jgi:hypothetical protein
MKFIHRSEDYDTLYGDIFANTQAELHPVYLRTTYLSPKDHDDRPVTCNERLITMA